MRFLKLAPAALALALAACGNNGQPRIYKVAIDQTALDALPGTCYRSGSAPSSTTAISNGFFDSNWTLWDGTNKQYLDVGAVTWSMGDARAIQIGTGNNPLPIVIEGGPKIFTVTGTFTTNSATAGTSTDARTVTITFDDTPGVTATGSIALQSTYTCNNCGQPSCQATLKFVGRRVDSQPTTLYSGQ